MHEGFLRLFSARPLGQVLRDLLDIFFVAYIVYRALLVLRGTRAMQMGIGLGIVFLVYLGAKLFELTTLLNLLSWLLSSIILIVVVVFQNDIRRALIRVGGKAWFSGGREQQSRVIDEVVASATELARHRMGAIIAFEQDANVLEFVKSDGIHIDSVVTRELLVSLFVPESVNKLHDGAVLIRDLKIARAGIFFPMPETKILDASLGSRHRAALGITEETDAVVVVVSEERGTISFCFSGNIVSNLDGQSLRHALLGLFGRSSRKKRSGKKLTSGGRTTLSAPPPRAQTVSPSPPSAVTNPDVSKPAAQRPPTAPLESKAVSAAMKGTTDADLRSTLRGIADGDPRTTLRGTADPDFRSTMRTAADTEGRAALRATAAPDSRPFGKTTGTSLMKASTSTPMPTRSTSESARSVAPGPMPPTQEGDRPNSERGRPAVLDLHAAMPASDTPAASQRTFVPAAQTLPPAAAPAPALGPAEGTPPQDEP